MYYTQSICLLKEHLKFTSSESFISKKIVDQATTMSAISQSLLSKFDDLNNNKPILHTKDMEDLKLYKILKAIKMKTKYGESIQIETENYVIFLSKRFNLITEEEIKEMSSGNYFIKKVPAVGDKPFRLELELFNLNDYIITDSGKYPVWN